MQTLEALNLNPTLARAELCRRNFFYFVQTFWHVVIAEDPIYNWHIPYLCDELQKIVEKVERREPKDYDLIINITPGTSKSTIASVMLPVWAWVRDASIRTLTASYSSTLSTDLSQKSRDIIRSDIFKEMFTEIEIKPDQDLKTHYKNTEGGERYSTSVTGTVTGFHAHLIIVDDPINPKSATSEADRITANQFMNRTLSTRKVSKSVTPTILIMQRLHEDDCTGNWLKNEDKDIKHICLPGEISNNVKPPELAARYIDGLMDVNRLNRKDLDTLKTDLGSYGYAGQVMQTPSPEDGGYWKKWIIAVEDKDWPEYLEEEGTDWDLAYTQKETNSASAYVTAGLLGNDMYISALGFEWLEFPDLMTFMTEQKEPHYIEAKASGKSAKQTLTNRGIPAIEVTVDGGDKIARTKMVTPYAEAGLIYCRRSILDKLYNDDKQGILLFPNTGDDLNDALVQSINRLLGGPKVFTF